MRIEHLLALVGVVAVVVGCYQAWPPLGFIVGGALVWRFAWTLRETREEQEQLERGGDGR